MDFKVKCFVLTCIKKACNFLNYLVLYKIYGSFKVLNGEVQELATCHPKGMTGGR